jgi:chaperonin cofactor prefoldin
VYLDLNHAFGSNFTLENKNEIGIIEEDGRMKMVYTVGKAIVKQSLENKTMEFIKLSDSIESIECMALSPTKNHIAIC